MEQVVERGTATPAQVPGYTVAGKTGTASKLVNGRYSKTDYHASFVGFVPSRQPAFTILVVIDSPHAGRTIGGVGGGADLPAHRRAALRHVGVAPTINPAAARARPGLGRRGLVGGARPHGGRPRARRRSSVVTGPPDGPGRARPRRARSRRAGSRGSASWPALTGDGIVIDQDPAAGHRRSNRARRAGCGSIACARARLRRCRRNDAARAPHRARRERAADAAAGARPRRRRARIRCVAVDRVRLARGVARRACSSRCEASRPTARPSPGRPSRRARWRSSPRPARPAACPVPWIRVSDGRLALARCSAAHFYGHPSREMRVVGITGTNGKTTTAYLVRRVFEAAGIPCGLMGTVQYRIGDDVRDATRTTPEAPDLQRMLREMVDAGCGACAMEVSSHALALRRVDGTRFAAGGLHEPDARPSRLPRATWTGTSRPSGGCSRCCRPARRRW